MTLSAGGYGSILQTKYIEKYIVTANRISLIDDFLSPEDYLPKYSNSEIYCVGRYEDPYDVLVPSYEFKQLEKLSIPFDKDNWNDKRLLFRFVPKEYFIPYQWIPQIDMNKQFISKLPEGSGSKQVEFVSGASVSEFSGRVYQEYCPGDELIVDCVVYTNTIFFTARRSIKRKFGKDVEISFNIENEVYNYLIILLSQLRLSSYSGAFNLQLRKHEDKWKVMEIDFRLSGNSIINLHYDSLISLYALRVKKPSMRGFNNEIANVIPLRGQFNERCKSIYKDSRLSIPSVVE
jgi:hypothetical protein